MSLIIKDRIQQLIAGYPTISDKYDVAPAVLEGNTALKFGQAVKFGATDGYFQPAADMASINEFAGFALATNVKVAENFPGTIVQINPGEAFNLFLDGGIAVELDDAATMEQVKSNTVPHIILATGKITTVDKFNEDTVVPIPNAKFTGIKETQGTKKIAEIYVKC